MGNQSTLIIFHSDSIVHFPLNNQESLASADNHGIIFVPKSTKGVHLYSGMHKIRNLCNAKK